MPKLATEIEHAITAARRRALIDQVRATPEMTIAQLSALDGPLGKLAGTLTVAELAGSAGRRARPSRPASKPKGKNGTRNTRTHTGRATLDARILELLGAAEASMGAHEIRSVVGGSADQIRTSLHRLVTDRKVKRTGRARATRYQAR